MGLRQCHAVAGYDDDALCLAQPVAACELWSELFAVTGCVRVCRLCGSERFHDRIEHIFGVAQHQRDMILFSLIVEWIVDTGVAWEFIEIAYDDVFRVFDVEDWHTINRCALGRICRRVNDVVSAYYDGDIGILEFLIDVLHLIEFVIRDIDFCKEDIHVSRHTAGHRMDSKLNVFAFRFEFGHQLFDN